MADIVRLPPPPSDLPEEMTDEEEIALMEAQLAAAKVEVARRKRLAAQRAKATAPEAEPKLPNHPPDPEPERHDLESIKRRIGRAVDRGREAALHVGAPANRVHAVEQDVRATVGFFLNLLGDDDE